MRAIKTRKRKIVHWKLSLFGLGAVIVTLNAAAMFFMLGRPKVQAAADHIPHYFATAQLVQPLPVTLEPKEFSNPNTVAAYQAAKEIPGVLAQQPCYCYCDRRGHRSLLDCFASKHGSDCDICVKEALFAMQEHRKGRSATQIRDEITRGAWKTISFQE